MLQLSPTKHPAQSYLEVYSIHREKIRLEIGTIVILRDT